MLKYLLVALLGVSNASTSPAQLTETERYWITSGKNVLQLARDYPLPIELSVDPNLILDRSPMGLAWDSKNRCKVVYYLRGNEETTQLMFRTFTDIPVNVLIEALTAHEVGHCWRRQKGRWLSLPEGLTDPVRDVPGATLEQNQEIHEISREEGYADLVALAWVAEHRPEQYAEVHRWFAWFRSDSERSGIYHDTKYWVALAADPSVFGTDPDLFKRAESLWVKALVRKTDLS